MAPELAAYIERLIADGQIKVIFEVDGYKFITTCRASCPSG